MEPLLASLPLAHPMRAKGQPCLYANIAAPMGAGIRNQCVFATGYLRAGQWELEQMTFSK